MAQVANKVAEIVMLLDGREVCCQSGENQAQVKQSETDVP